MTKWKYIQVAIEPTPTYAALMRVILDDHLSDQDGIHKRDSVYLREHVIKPYLRFKAEHDTAGVLLDDILACVDLDRLAELKRDKSISL